MAEHSLAIHRFQTRLALTGLRDDGPALGREVGRTVRELLPAAIAGALEPLLGGRHGVLRIDRIALKIRIARGEISALRLASLLAREIARAVAERAEGRGGGHRAGAGFAFWPDHTSFAAAYLARRLGLAPAPDWAFPDFRALDHLAPHETALEFIAARPAILAALARLVGAAGAPALAAGLPEWAAALLLERLVTGVLPDLPAGAESELAAMIDGLAAGTQPDPARAAIAAAAVALSAGAAEKEDGKVRQVAMLARLAVALTALRAATLAAWGREPTVADLTPAALVHLPEPARSLVQAALGQLAQAEPVRLALARLLKHPWRHIDTVDPTAKRAAEAAAAPHAITSRIAGIGLLMPSALAHGLPERLPPAAFNRTLAAAAGPRAEAAARLDPLLAALAPFDPRDPDHGFPPVPEALRAVVPEQRREGAAESEGAAGWAACLVHDFAAGLSGFETSSLDYLRRQFLARPGALHIADGSLILVLDPLPLGILLRLSGLQGWSGRLPQARHALLRIEIREG